MTKDMKDLLRVLNAHAVKYLVVGGYAYGVHLEPRTTKDLDLFIRADLPRLPHSARRSTA